MKQSTLHINHINHTCTFDNIKTSLLSKEYTNCFIIIWISSNNNEFNITLNLTDYVVFRVSNNSLYLEFKTPHYFNLFLQTNHEQLTNFKISKTSFIDVKGV